MKSDLDLQPRTGQTTGGGEGVSAQDQLSPEQVLQMLHELQVRQVELETQNDELRRSQAELGDTLRRNQDLLTSLSCDMPGMIFRYQLFPDGRSCFPYVSAAIHEIYGITPEQVGEDATPVFAVLHPDDYYGVVASIQDSARTLKPWVHEYRITLPNQGVRRLFGNARPKSLPDGSVLLHGIIIDITAQKIIAKEQTEETIPVMSDQPDVSQLFDEIELLNNFDGDRDFAESILNDVLQALPDDMKTLGELAKGDDAQAICLQAHTLKSLAANICAPALREICYLIETAAHENNLEAVRKLLTELERTALITVESIRARNNV